MIPGHRRQRNSLPIHQPVWQRSPFVCYLLLPLPTRPRRQRACRDRNRGGPDTTMIDIMRGIPDEDIEAMAHFLAHYDD